jgi:hypothetical protein
MRVRTGTNGEQLPPVNGFPLRLVLAPGYATYWVKMLSDLERCWINPTRTTGRKWPTPFRILRMSASSWAKQMLKMILINRIVPRSFVTNIASGMPSKARNRAWPSSAKTRKRSWVGTKTSSVYYVKHLAPTSGRPVLAARSVISVRDDDASVRAAINNLLSSH